MTLETPTLTIVAGPNGVGKTTLVESLREAGVALGETLNPDVLAQDRSGADFAKQRDAARRLLAATEACLRNGRSFTRETTLSGKEALRMIAKARARGFRTQLYFIGVDTVDIAKDRVAQRFEAGGHDVPREAQDRRFARSLENGARAATLVDRAAFFDNGADGHRLVALIEKGVLSFRAEPQPAWLRVVLGAFERHADGSRP